MSARKHPPRRSSLRRAGEPFGRTSFFGPVLERLEDRVSPTVDITTLPTWYEQGPGGIRGGQAVGTGTLSNRVSGAIQTIAVHPTNPDILYVGSVNGGIWKTTNATAPNALDLEDVHWTPLTDQLSTLSISSLAFSPLDNTNQTIYAGLGSLSNGRADGKSHGVAWTTNGGVSWNRGPFAELELFGGRPVSKVIPTTVMENGGQVILAGVLGGVGLLRSRDGGMTWTNISEAVSGLGSGSISDLIADPTSSTTFYAAVADNDLGLVFNGIYRSTDTGLTWTRIDDLVPASALDKAVRISLALGPTAASPLYAAFIAKDIPPNGTATGQSLKALLRSTNFRANPAGVNVTWLNLPLPFTTEQDGTDNDNDGQTDESGEVTGIHPGQQGMKNFSMVVDPTDPNILYIGGDRQPVSTAANQAGLRESAGRLFRLFPSGGVDNYDFEQIVGTLAGGTAPHADSRFMIFQGPNTILEGDDGGIWKLTNPRTSSRRWSSLNTDLRLSEVTSVAYDPLNNAYFIGTQDNGSSQGPRLTDPVFASADPLQDRFTWDLVRKGDGNIQIAAREGNDTVRYTMGNSFGGSLRRRFHAGSSTPFDTDTIGFNGLYSQDATFPGYDKIPYAINAIDPTRMLIGYEHLYESTDRGDNLTRVVARDKGGEKFTAVAYGGREPNGSGGFVNRERVAYAAQGDHILARGTSGGFIDRVPRGARYIQDIVMDPDDWRIAYAVDFTKIYRTLDGGQSWTEIESPGKNVAGIPLWSLEIVKAANGEKVLFVGSREGVYRSIGPDIGASWTVFGQGMPLVPVTDLHYDPTDHLLIAGTFGRGVWATPDIEAVAAVPSVLRITGSNSTTTGDTIRLNQRSVSPRFLDIFDNAPGSTPTITVPILAFDRMEIQTRSGPDLVTLDLSEGFLNPPGHILVDMGSDAQLDTLRLEKGPGTFQALGIGLDPNNPIHVEVTGGERTLILEPVGVNAYTGTVPLNQAQLFAGLGAGLEGLADWSSGLQGAGMGGELPALGTSLGRALAGAKSGAPTQVRDAEGEAGGEELRGRERDEVATSLLHRLFGTGPGAFALGDIGTTITTPQDLQTRLDALDDIPNNVTLSSENGVTRFDVRIRKVMDGEAALDANLLGGTVALGGTVELTGLVEAHLIFGIDANGFFLDAESGANPEFILSNLQGVVEGEGRIGFLDVALKDGILTADPDVQIRIDLTDPGLGVADDGLIRLAELTEDFTNLVSTEVVGENSLGDGKADLELSGAFTISAFNFPLLSDLRLSLRWNDINDLTSGTIAPVAGSNGQKLLDFLNVNADQILSGINGVADLIQQTTGISVLDQKIPLLNKTIDEVVNGTPQDLALANASVSSISAVEGGETFKTFDVFLAGTNLLKNGVAAGQTIHYRSGNVVVEGILDRVDATSFTVRFDAALNQTPNDPANNPAFTIARPGGLKAMFASFSSGLNFQIPTLQDLVEELSRRTGLDFLNDVTLTGPLSDLVLEMPLTLDPAAFTYTQALSLGDRFPGLTFDATGNFSITVDPRFRLRLGIRLAPNLDLSQRFFLVDNTDPEIELTVQARLDNPNVVGTLGFLDVRLQEVGSQATNKGLDFYGTFTLNLSGGGPDGRITLGELSLSGIQPGIDARLDIDGIQIRADVGTSNLGTLAFSLEGEGNGPGNVTSLSGFSNLLSSLSVTGESNFSNLTTITPQMVLAVLDQLVLKLTALGAGEPFQKRLPVINKSVAEIIDLGQEWAARLNAGGAATDAQVLSLKGLQSFLNSKLANAGLVITLNPGEILVGFNFNPTFARTVPFNFDFNLGSGVAGLAPTLAGQGQVNLSGGITSRLTLGMLTTPNLEFQDRFFLAADRPSAGQTQEISVTASLSSGYDRNNDGDTTDSNEANPLNFQAAVGPLSLNVVNARALIELNAGLDIKGGSDNDNRLTFREIVSGPNNANYGGSFAGTAQAIFPLDGDGNGSVANNPASLNGTGDARITIAGKLEHLDNIIFNEDPVYHIAAGPSVNSTVDISDPLTPTELDPLAKPGKFRIAATNLTGLVANGFLSFKAITEGLEKFLEWGEGLLGLNVLDYKLPLVGKSLRDALDFFGNQPGSLGTLLDGMRNSTVGLADSVSNAAVRFAFTTMANALKGINGIRVIGDANQDGRVDDVLAGNVLQKSDDLLRFDRGSVIGTRTVVAGQYTLAPVAGSSEEFEVVHNNAAFDFGGQEVAVGDVVRFRATDATTATGRVTLVDSLTPNRVRFRRDLSTKTPTASGDVQFDVRALIGATFLVKFMPHVEKTFPLDLGLRFLDLKANANVTLAADLEITLGFGVNKTDGFFIRTEFGDILVRDLNNPNGPLVLHANDPELKVSASVSLSSPVNGLGFQLGFLEFKNNLALTGANNFLSATFATDLRNPNNTGKIRFNELLNLGAISTFVTPSLGVRAKLDIPMTVDVNSNSELPSISGRFTLDWARLNNDGTLMIVSGNTLPFDVTQGVPAPKIQIRDVSLNAGSFLTKITKPILEKIRDNNPLAPVIEVLTEPLPILNKSAFELLVNVLPANSGTRKAAEFLFQVATFVNEAASTASSGNNLTINFGTIKIEEEIVPGTSGTGTSTQIGGGSQSKATPDEGSDEQGNAPGGANDLPNIPGSGLPGPVGDFFEKLGNLGIIFPVLKFSNLGKLLTGGVVDLVVVNLPELELTKSFNISFPIFNFGIPYLADVNVNAFIGGEFGLIVNVSAGLDTRGLRLRKDDPQGNHSILEGFYLGDFDPGTDGVIQPTDVDRPEIAFEASLNAGIDASVRLIGLPIGRATGTGSITGTVGVDLNDDDEDPQTQQPLFGDERSVADRHDGRLYLDELVTVVDTTGTPLGLFDIVGKIEAGLSIRLFVALVLDRTFEWNWTLAEFETTITSGGPSGPPDLANLFANGGSNKKLTFTSSTGTAPGDRGKRGASNHAGGDNIQVLLVDKNQDPNDGPTVVSFSDSSGSVSLIDSETFTVTQTGFGFADKGVAVGQRVNYLIGLNPTGSAPRSGTVMAVSNDSFTIHQDQPFPNDSSQAPIPNGQYVFKSGRETIRIRKASVVEDFGPLETGANFVSDISLVNLLNVVGPANDPKYAMTHLGAGGDRIQVDPLFPGAVSLAGGDGDDTLLGARLNDTLLGNAGDDQLDGGGDLVASGNDTLVGGGGHDQINGREGNDRIIGDYDTTLESIPAASVTEPARREGADLINAGAGNDSIWGDNRGSSTLVDGPAAVIPSGSGLPNDIIVAGGGNDRVFGGKGHDRVEADEVDSPSSGGAGNDTVEGGDGNDSLYGGDGNDSLIGGAGFDRVVGGLGDDRLFAGNNNPNDAIAFVQQITIPLVGTFNLPSPSEILFGDTESPNGGPGGQDFLDGTDAAQLLARGGSGDDTIVGGIGSDDIRGNHGNDALIGGPENDIIDGGSGNDDMVGGTGQITRLNPATGLPETFGYGFLPTGFTINDRRTDGADTMIVGDLGFDVTVNGNDAITASRSVNTAGGEVSGLSDTLNVSHAPNGVLFNTDNQINDPLAPNSDVFVGRKFENFIGTPFNDTVNVRALTTTSRTISGGSGGINTLTIDAQAQSVTISKTAIKFGGGFHPIYIDNIHNLTLNNVSGNITIQGDDLDNLVTLKLVNGVLTYQFDGGPVVPLNGPVGAVIAVALGKGNDTLVVDLSGGDFLAGRTFSYSGEDGTDDRLRVIGPGTGALTYAAANADYQGTLSRAGIAGNLTFQGVEDHLELSQFASVELRPQGDGATLILGGAFGSGSKTLGQVSGNKGQNTFTPLHFTEIANVILDLTSSDTQDDPNDIVALGNFSGNDITGLTDLRVKLGDGNDLIQSNAWGSNLTLDGGAGNDTLTLTLKGHTATLLNTFQLSNDLNTLASSIPSQINGSTLDLGGHEINVAEGAAADDLILGASLSGTSPVGLKKIGPGTLVLNGANSYSGPTTVNAGTMKLGASNRIPNASAVIVSAGATFRLNGFDDIVDQVTNNGTVHLGGGSELTAPDYKHGIGGLTDLAGGTLTITDPNQAVNVGLGSTFQGPGTVNGRLINSSLVVPGDASKSGTLTINGNYTQSAGNPTFSLPAGRLNVQIFSATLMDRLTVNGTATLAGVLNVSRVNNFNPVNGTSYIPLSYTTRSGDFTTRNGLTLSTNPSRFLNPVLGPTALTLTATQGTPPVGLGGAGGAPEGEIFTFQVGVTNPTGNPVEFRLGPGSPPTARIDSTTGLLSWRTREGFQIVPIFVEVIDTVTGLSDTTLVECTVTNVDPSVNAGPDAVLLPNGEFSRQVLVRDPGPDTLVATVDYGDGAGPQPLTAGPDGQFPLQHRYATPGTYQVTVRAQDDDGGTGSASFTVTVTTEPYLLNEQFVRQLYRDLLGREADAPGLTFFTRSLSGNIGREQVAEALLASSEYRTKVVRDAYRAVLGREADPSGLEVWVDFLAHGGTAAQLKALLFASAEYRSRAVTDEAFLSGLYLGGLGRALDSSGRAYFGDLLAAGTSREAVALAVLESSEALQGRVANWYKQYLSRTADDVGRDVFFSLLTRGGSDDVAVAVLLASDEYFRRG